ncbi:MAG: hypothetical protein ACTHN0_16040 [Aquihabitans sp.]
MTDAGPSTWRCCFCGEAVDGQGDDAFRVALSRPGFNGRQQWMAHEDCIAEAVHEGAQFEPEIYWASDS